MSTTSLHLPASTWTLADPAPLGLSGFAATTFLLSGHNAGWIPGMAFTGPALFYGGLVQLLAGMWEFRNGNVFGATVFSTYGAFWMSLFTFVILELNGFVPADEADFSVGFFLVAFLVFSCYGWMGSLFLNKALFAIFSTLIAALILLIIGKFYVQPAGYACTAAGGYVGIICASLAWYLAAALMLNGVIGHPFFPVGEPLLQKPRPGHAKLVDQHHFEHHHDHDHDPHMANTKPLSPVPS